MNKSNPKYNKIIITIIASIFVVYNFFVYTTAKTQYQPLNKLAIRGEQLYQKNNCTACHQLYGLGGYLGPDLTNVISNKGADYVKSFLNSGVRAMPKFHFSDEEKDALVQFLTAVDKTGYFPNKNAKLNPDGWVDIKTKNNE